ncbi:DinB family protein [Niallia nealsonii]|uniref:Damage-inducible protein DinB n=1 Tax=Niallia nealsonii TaxID=115979 RepID=A0A2N0Z584_9BACI|nr:DinB family protein [Niallia nealsonii]PKG24654.1 damage-inducible protein DinB [Niallia nealsonii]
MQTIQNMFDHLNWANQNILKTLQNIEGESQKTIHLFSHILLSEHIWFTRLKGLDSSSLAIWDKASLEICAEMVKQNHQNFYVLFSCISDNDPNTLVFYKNSMGKEFQNTIGDILTHIALHGQYHRGQINQRLRENGLEPVNIDYITFRRG